MDAVSMIDTENAPINIYSGSRMLVQYMCILRHLHQYSIDGEI